MKKKSYHIYLIENIKTGKIYVGKTSQRFPLREEQHMRCMDHSPIDDAIRAEGRDNFKVTVYKNCDTIEDLDKAEMDIMSELRKEGRELYNIYYGKGHHAILASKGKQKYVYPNIAMCSEMTGFIPDTIRTACNFGLTLNGWKYSWADEKGHAIEGFIKKFINPMKKKKPVRSKIRCIETGEVYPSIVAAAKAVGVGSRSLNKVFTGLHKTSAGYHWERVKE